jgi:hypothetical protein
MLFASLAKARQPGGASEVNPDSKCLINAVIGKVKSWYGTCVESRCDAVV